jgi:hypothetical protein
MPESINEIARVYYLEQIEKGLDIDLTMCPKTISKKMLADELMTGDLKLYIKDVDEDYLWNQYLYINTVSTNKFGFVNSPFDKVQPFQQYLYTGNLSRNKVGSLRSRSHTGEVKEKSTSVKRENTVIVPRGMSKSKGNTVKVNVPRGKSKSKSKTYNTRSPTPYYMKHTRRTGRKGRSQTYSALMVGGENQMRKRMVVEGLNNRIYPHWSSGLSTIVKINKINNKDIYARGTSLPVPNEPLPAGSVISPDQYCTNTLNFYRYIKNIPNLISLQGCDLDWTGYRYKPKYCDNLEEKANWNKICNEYDNNTNPRTDHIKEFYWVDMSAGFFSVYQSLSNIDFTDISNSSIIHCLAGFGRTGTVLMLIICINYYKEFPLEYETDFLIPERNDPDNSKTSNRIIRKLKSLFHQYLEVDQEIPIDPAIPINKSIQDSIRLLIFTFGIEKIFDELFTNFYRRGARNRQVNYTSLNVLVTRINYILYFTAKACDQTSVILYETHQHNATSVSNPLVMDSLVLRNPEELTLSNVNVIVKNPVVQELAIAELSKRGFDFVFFTRLSRANGSSANRSSRRGRSGNQNNIPSLITTDLAPIERLTPLLKSTKKNKTPKCVIS